MSEPPPGDTRATDTSENEQSARTTGTAPDVSLTTAKAAKRVGVSPRTIRRWIEKGSLPAITGTGGVFYVFAQDVESARLASMSRSSGAPHTITRAAIVEDNNTVPDISGTPRSSYAAPDPGGDAAGAVLVAWRDTVLAPVVEELSATRREIGQVRQKLGRAEAERDQAAQEREALRAELTAVQVAQGRPQERAGGTQRGDDAARAS
jgi:excisionase family DNA binding protein